MKTIGRFCLFLFVLSALCVLPFCVSAEESGAFVYSVSDGKATICSVNRAAAVGELVIPEEIGGFPVTEIGSMVFYDCKDLTGVTLLPR